MTDVGIVIVTYNSAAVIDSCLEAALRASGKIVVIDNASEDDTAARAVRHGVQVITNSTNLGFAAAVNQGFLLLDVPYILILNPDTVLKTSLEHMRSACDMPNAAGAGGKLEDSQGNPQVGFMVRKFPTPSVLVLESLLLNRAWSRNPINRSYRCLGLDDSKLQTVDQPAGAFLMVRRVVWKELGGFDENFWPLWFEDVDFCRRAAEHGYLWYYVPQAVGKHTGAHSIVKLTLEKRRIYWYGSLLRYSAKHFHASEMRMICLAVMLGSFLRMLYESVLHRSLQPVAAYCKVIRLAAQGLTGGTHYSRSSVFGS